MDTCSAPGCGKPVYFAERKTSLGRHWHPNCLRCSECKKILSPGQHAEHKGVPYCHKPCYGALFGPQMFGYGSNVTSPANFRKSGELANESEDTVVNGETSDGLNCIFKTSNTSPGPIKLQRFSIGNITPPQKVYQKRNSAGSILDSYASSSGYSSNGSTKSISDLKPVIENSSESGLKCIYQSNSNDSPKTSSVGRSNSDAGNFVPLRQHSNKPRGAELFKRVQSYNENHQGKRGQTLAITEDEGNVRISGPLQIYWGLKKPIILQHCDDVPAYTIPKKRHSVISDKADLQPLQEVSHESTNGSPDSPRRNRFNLGLDDSALSSPSSDVVMRRTHIKKSNTVAYRGERPNKWKRASINGHIYNYDTSVFTPVLGSCTSVTVDNKMTVSQVVKTLLEKFKVENQPEEYHLCIITEQEGEKMLKETDIPLLERLMLGPTDSIKIFIRDKQDTPPAVNPAHIPDDSSPTTETPIEDTPLPEEVEQLMNIPEPVLRGLLIKFKQDEDKEVRRLKAKYERIRRRVRQIIDDKKSTSSRC